MKEIPKFSWSEMTVTKKDIQFQQVTIKLLEKALMAERAALEIALHEYKPTPIVWIGERESNFS